MAIILQGNGESTFSNNITSSTGDLTLGDGNLVVPDTHGIDFSAIEGSNAASSLLNDYEEGTFSPNLIQEAGTTTTTWGASGSYTKIGRTLFGFITLANVNNVAGGVYRFVLGGPVNGGPNTMSIYGFMSESIPAYYQQTIVYDECRILGEGANAVRLQFSVPGSAAVNIRIGLTYGI